MTGGVESLDGCKAVTAPGRTRRFFTAIDSIQTG